ncbi:hypothetical protein ACHAXR_003601 [Thalassiosira sp. AJA248-18]
MTTGYGAIDGYQAEESDHPPSTQNDSLPSTIRDLLSRTWVRIAAAVSLALIIVTLSSRHSSAARGPWGPSPQPDSDGEQLEFFYDDQLVNHFNGDTSTWSNRYYKSKEFHEGPGHPIFLIIGGEGTLDPNPNDPHGMLYPFVSQHLAPHFGAAVIMVEHRFYGPYQPIMGREATVSELIELLTPQQAMADMIQLAKVFKDELNCAQYDRSSEKYCPVITVGGSYPGFLSAMFRLVYPDIVDISYASSAPLKLYDQSANQNVYYDIVTKAADKLSPGCADATRTALDEAKELINEMSSVKEAMKGLKMCFKTVPEYITDVETLSTDVMMAVGFSFANYDMGAYPPGEDLGLYKACQVFQDEDATSMEKVANFFQLLKEDPEEEEDYPDLAGDEDKNCFDLSIFLPDGDNPRIQTSDWSGSGGGNDGRSWDFQLCTTLVDQIGFSEESMFPTRLWTYADLTEYCQLRYGEAIIPQPLALVRNLGFDDLVKKGASYILFTNGMQDMWSGGSYLEDVSDTIVALNFENGAHHSDLNHVGPMDNDTEDIREGYVQITDILEKWLGDIKVEYKQEYK